MSKVTLNNITGGYAAVDLLNENFDAIEAAFENTLSRNGAVPNTWLANQDANHKRLLNVADPVDGKDAVNKDYVINAVVDASPIAFDRAAYHVDRFTGDGSDVSFELSAAPGTSANSQVYTNGAYQNKNTYAISGTTLTFTEAPPLDSSIEVFVIEPLTVAVADAANVQYSPGSGAPQTTVEAKLREVVSVIDFGADPTGTTDSSAAFITAGASEKIVLIPPGTYTVKNTIPVYGKFVGTLGASIINLTIDNSEGLGFWMQPNSSIEGLTINRNVAVTPVNGARGNAIFVGEYSGGTPIGGNTGKLYENVVIRDIEINATGTKWNTLSLIGNVSHFQVENIWIDGIVTIPILCHWTRVSGGYSYHPRNGSIKNIHITAKDNYFDNVDYGGVYLSACHDISVENTYAENCSRGPVIASGDVGDYYASPESKGRVLTNILWKNIAVKNWKNEGIWIVGRSALISAGVRSIANVDGMSISLENITMQRGADSTGAEGLIVRFVKNLQVKNLLVFNVDGEQETLTSVPGVSITAANNISIQGDIRVPQAIEVISGNGIELDVDVNWNATNYGSSSYVGLLIDGATTTTTTSSAISTGDTSITLATAPCDIYPGMEFTQGGNRFYFTGAAVSGDTGVTIGILPAVAGISSGATITIENGPINVVVKDSSFAGYYYNARLTSSTHLVPKNVSFTNCTFTDSGLRHILCQSASDLNIQDCSFEKGNQLNNASGNDISILSTTQNLVISGNSFNQNADSLSKYCVNIGSSVDGIIVSNNNFYDAVTGAIFFDDFGGSFDNVVSANYFASGITTRVSSAHSSTTIGGNTVGFSSAAPTTGTFRQGDVFFNTGAASAGYAGWICTVAGTPGTWRTFGVIS